MKGRCYVAGPMTGLPLMNFPAFNAAAAALRADGWTVVNPVEINGDPEADRVVCLRADIRELLDCDTIALLPGWENSKGARLESHVADELKMARIFLVEPAPSLIAADAQQERE